MSIDGPTDFWTWKNSPFPGITPDPTGQLRNARSSVLNDPSKLANVSLVQFLRIQAEQDANVTPDQGCELAAALEPPSTNFYFNSNATASGLWWFPPHECAAQKLSWQTGPYLPNIEYDKLGSLAHNVWLSPTFLMYSDSPLPNLDEHASIPIQSWPQWASFVNAFIGGGVFEKPWHASIPAQYIPFE